MLLLWIIGFVISLTLIYLVTLKGHYQVDRSILINAPINKVYDRIRSVKSWPQWSPWLHHDEDPNLKYQGKIGDVGSSLEWHGPYIGSGKLNLISQVSPYSLIFELKQKHYLTSVTNIEFQLEETSTGTRLNWSMNTSLPFIFCLFLGKRQHQLNKDYDIALARLAGQLSHSNEPKFEFLGIQPLPPIEAVTRPFSGSTPEIFAQMEIGYSELHSQLGPNNCPNGAIFAQYDQAEPEHNYFCGKIGIPIQNLDICECHAELVRNHGDFFSLRFTGSYEQLSYAWHVAIKHSRLHHYKWDKSRPHFEIFQAGPHNNSDPSHFITELYLPIK
ncbi:hypothetical protein MED121_08156 [Marinomonas sp. MED121]|uniref:SRPBCC family protein n=1 Tax=Marinomonas sp. MED121 TaxID=314277 RepID=UPI000069025A|nr:SRPBCC family protein [Marinomonas sp. MED121]EAQ63467.1 hypothetical protein MED121_08156 [Marinomonas sp. MED121]